MSQVTGMLYLMSAVEGLEGFKEWPTGRRKKYPLCSGGSKKIFDIYKKFRIRETRREEYENGSFLNKRNV